MAKCQNMLKRFLITLKTYFNVLKNRKIEGSPIPKTPEAPKSGPILKGKGLPKDMPHKDENKSPIKPGGLRGKGLDIAKK